MFSLSEIPAGPGLYVLRDRNGHVAYVGISNNVRSRVDQHLYRRDSSIATGVSTTSLNPDYVTRVDWWVDPLFEDKASREAAEVSRLRCSIPRCAAEGTCPPRHNRFCRVATSVPEYPTYCGNRHMEPTFPETFRTSARSWGG